MTIHTTSRGLQTTTDFLDRINELADVGPDSLEAARENARGDMVAILRAWVDDENTNLVTDHIVEVVSDEVMGPQLLRIVDLLISKGLRFMVVLEEGDGAVAYLRGADRMVVVVATPDQEG